MVNKKKGYKMFTNRINISKVKFNLMYSFSYYNVKYYLNITVIKYYK